MCIPSSGLCAVAMSFVSLTDPVEYDTRVKMGLAFVSGGCGTYVTSLRGIDFPAFSMILASSEESSLLARPRHHGNFWAKLSEGIGWPQIMILVSVAVLIFEASCTARQPCKAPKAASLKHESETRY